MFGHLLGVFFRDNKVAVALLLVVIDLILGMVAAVKLGTFRLSYIADFLRNDVLFKLVPYFVLYAGALVAGGTDVVIPGLDLGVIAGAAYIWLVAAMVGSIVSSLGSLGVPIPAPANLKGLFAGENSAPPKD